MWLFVLWLARRPAPARPAQSPIRPRAFDRQRDGRRGLRGLSHHRRSADPVAHLLPPDDARRVAADDQADGQPERHAARSGRGPGRSCAILSNNLGLAPEESAGWHVRGRAPAHRVRVRSGPRHRSDLQRLPLDGAHPQSAAHAGGVGAGGGDAPGLLPDCRPAGLPGGRYGRTRAGRSGRDAAPTPSDEPRHRSSRGGVSAPYIGVGRVVGERAPAATRRDLGRLGPSPGPRPRLRPDGDHGVA